MLTLWAAVIWTVNYFPTYAMVSGWSTKGYMACLVWKEDDHKWREKDKEFGGNTEHRLRSREWSSDEILERLNRLDFAPYGKTKNVFDALVGTILDIEGKTKDTIKARLDLERVGIRRDISNRKASWRVEKKCMQQGKARRINYRGLGSI
ncbi:hypothetical protein L3X38_024626 [Prunus dulcis]|uniref:Uncharacterized protein n=1 Tax=Prunus dulcis TaxID=3755 RepID=A0AAD4Z782_PRUDU|nr:hypothetical protein L3X38_024626 [Prunus dulcis]